MPGPGFGRWSADGTPVKAWDMAERRTTAKRPEWVYAGRIDLTHAESRTLVATAEPEVGLSAGQVVRWTPPQAGPSQAGAAVVVYVGKDKTFLFVPPAWGNLAEAPAANRDPHRHASRPGQAGIRPSPCDDSPGSVESGMTRWLQTPFAFLKNESRAARQRGRRELDRGIR